MYGLLSDIRQTLRGLARTPGFTLFVILTLALGIGVNTAVFSVADAFLNKAVPFPQPERVVMLLERSPHSSRDWNDVSPADALDFERQTSSFQHVAAFGSVTFNLSGGGGEPEQVDGNAVTTNFFDTLGMRPLLGRTFTPGEDQAGSENVAVLSYGFWQRRFGADPTAVGREVKLNGATFTIIGVMVKGFNFPPARDLWTPLTLTPRDRADRETHSLRLVARLKEGARISQASAEMDTLAARLAKSYPRTNKGWGAVVLPVNRFVTEDLTRQYTSMLLYAVFFVLMIACANVVNLQFAKLSGRHKEFAVRTALGAGRWRIVRQLLVESTILSLAGGAASLLFAAWGLHLILVNMPAEVGKYVAGWYSIQLDGRALGYTFLLAIVAGIVSGLAPALRTGSDVNETLKEGGRGGSPTRRRQRLRGVLVAGEIAAAIVLLAGAGLMVKGTSALIHVNESLHPESLLTMQLTLPDSRYPEPHQRAAFYDGALRRVEALPGVSAATLVTNVPYGDGPGSSPYAVDGQGPADPSQQPAAQFQSITSNYFDTAGIPLVQGRGFQATDGPDAARVAIVSQNLAERWWPGSNPIGRRVRPAGRGDGNEQWLTVVGVVKNVRYDWTQRDVAPTIYQPYSQRPRFFSYFMVRTKGDPLALATPLRHAVAAVDPDQPLYEIQTLDHLAHNSLLGISYVAVMLSVLGAIALVLSSVGIYGLMAYAVSERTREIGIRMALGAESGDILGLVTVRGLALTLAGMVIGLGISYPLARLLSSLIFGVSAGDLATFGGVSLLLAAVALAATWLPARRAMSVDPIIALRYE